MDYLEVKIVDREPRQMEPENPVMETSGGIHRPVTDFDFPPSPRPVHWVGEADSRENLRDLPYLPKTSQCPLVKSLAFHPRCGQSPESPSSSRETRTSGFFAGTCSRWRSDYRHCGLNSMQNPAPYTTTRLSTSVSEPR